MLWYSLEVPGRDTSNEYPQLMFLWIDKKLILWVSPLILSYGIYPKHGIPKIWTFYYLVYIEQDECCKQCRPWSDAAWSGLQCLLRHVKSYLWQFWDMFFLYFSIKSMSLIFIRSASSRHFYWVLKTYVFVKK